MGTRWRSGLATAGVLVACATVAPAAAGAATTELGARDNGRTVTVERGDDISIRLRSCEGSCGYRWRTTQTPKSSVLRRTSTRLSGMVRTFTYRATGTGRTSLRLSYDPPGTPRARRHFRLTVKVARPACKTPSEARVIDRNRQAVLYAGSVGTFQNTRPTLLGCARSTGKVFEIYQSQGDRYGYSDSTPHVRLRGHYAGFAQRTHNQRFPGRPDNTVRVFDLRTGNQVWQVAAKIDAAGPYGPYDDVTALAVTYQGDAAWVIEGSQQAPELWVRDGAGSVYQADAGPIDPESLQAEGDSVRYRHDESNKRIRLNAPPPLKPLRLGPGDGRGKTYRVRRGTPVVVRLPSCESSCGYSWRRVKRPNPLVLTGLWSRLDRGDAGEFREFHYKALRRGRTSVRLAYVPPGRNARVAKRFAMRVVVR